MNRKDRGYEAPSPRGPLSSYSAGGGEYRQVQSSHAAGGILKKTLCMQSGSGGQKIEEVEGPYPPPRVVPGGARPIHRPSA